ncbi:MAG: FHA domain-containing protein [Lachnospiraceae bacterium]|nr:FHA domain-containing protein [Lachnospiraceae bacterium]
MNISFRKNLNRSYMVIEKIPAFSENDFMVQMLLQNDIRTLLKFRYETVNGKTDLLYDISSRQVFQRQFEINKMTGENLKAFCYSVRSMINALEEYLLEPNNIILKKECIFTDPEGKQYEFCYHPYYHGDIMMEFRELFNHILQIINYEDEKTVRLAYEIHAKLQSDNFTLADIMEALNSDLPIPSPKIEKIESEEIDLLEELNQPLPEVIPERSFFEKISDYLKGRNLIDVLEDINNKELRMKIDGYSMAGASHERQMQKYTNGNIKQEHAQGGVAVDYSHNSTSGVPLGQSFMEESVYPQRQRLPVKGTILLEDPEPDLRKLVGRKSQQGHDFDVDGFPFTIGKLEGYVNAVINVPAVSRLHARIYQKPNGDYQIEDMNSTNGTFVNNQRMSPYTKTPLHVGDVIALADEEFEFR